MNSEQAHWIAQAASDYHAFRVLSGEPGIAICQPLHSLQMATEKLTKAVSLEAGHSARCNSRRPPRILQPTHESTSSRNRTCREGAWSRFARIAFKLAPAKRIADDRIIETVPEQRLRRPERRVSLAPPPADRTSRRFRFPDLALFHRRCP